MPALGFGSSVGSRLPDLANFPSDGLLALYKCDEREGGYLYDSCGNFPRITLKTGIMLDAVAGDCYHVDTTGLSDAMSGDVADGFFGFEITTPAATGGAVTHNVIALSGTTPAPVVVTVNEITTTSLFNVTCAVRTLRDGSTNSLVTFGNTYHKLKPSTTYLVVGRFITSTSGVIPSCTYSVMECAAQTWTDFESATGTAGAHTIAPHANAEVQLLANATTPANFWNGRVAWITLGSGNIPLSSLKALARRPGKTNIRNIIGTTNARFWDFRTGAGTTVIERCTDTLGTISGTVAWADGVAYGTQTALRQGNPYYGRPGLKIGGEASYAPASDAATTDSSVAVSSDSVTGWTLQWTGCVGPRDPASAGQPLVWLTAPSISGGAITDITLMPGAGFSLSAAQNIVAHVKRQGATDAGSNASATVTTADSVNNGRLATYTMTCYYSEENTNWNVAVYRQEIGESTATAISGHATWTDADESTYDFRKIRTSGVQIGGPAFDAEAVIGFVGIWNRPLTTAEMAHCHNMAVARMKGDPVYAAGAVGLYGNGTENFPYKELRSIWRKMQPGQTVYCGAGEYTDRCVASSSTLSPASQDFTFIGAGPSTTKIIAGAGATDYPFSSEGGTQYWSGVAFDANDAAARAYDGGNTAPANSAPVHSFDNCHFLNSKNSSGAGSGMVSRALYVRMNNCEASGNESHGAYIRIASDAEGNHRAVVTNFYAHDNGEDGLKFATDTTDPNMATRCSWKNCIIDRVKVDGGLRQVWLAGVEDSVITNLLLLNSTNTGGVPGALRLGHPSGGETDVDTEDGCWNNRIANVTIVGAAGYAVYDARSEGTTIQNLICEGNAKDYGALSEGSAVITYAAGDAASDKLPTGTGNIIDATIAFTNAAGGDYTLTALSDGYGDGVNLTGLSDEAESDFAGTARPTTGAWNMGAY